MDKFRGEFAKRVGCNDSEPFYRDQHDHRICAHPLEAWRKFVGDPEDEVYQWLVDGALGGLRSHPSCTCIFPPSREDEDGLRDPEELYAEGPMFASYDSVEEDDDAWDEVMRLVGETFLDMFHSYGDAVAYLNVAELILSKFGLIKKFEGGKLK